MSLPKNGKPRRRPDPVANILGPLDGARIPGGCEHCDAYQTAAPVQAGVWSVTVHHDAWCPWLKQRKESNR
jgi:hypothetical protein